MISAAQSLVLAILGDDDRGAVCTYIGQIMKLPVDLGGDDRFIKTALKEGDRRGFPFIGAAVDELPARHEYGLFLSFVDLWITVVRSRQGRGGTDIVVDVNAHELP